LGDASCLTAAMLGLGALLAASATAFTVLKLAGAAYLVFLGVKMWRRPPLPRAIDDGGPGQNLWRVFAHTYFSTVMNPKSVLFFMVFVPQFMNPRAPLPPQLAAMLASVLVCGTTVDGSYSLFASTLRRFTRSERAQRVVGRVTGGLLIGEGVLAAASRGLAL
jgi:threonine/homoserine/homoserine lactone efflux protein